MNRKARLALPALTALAISGSLAVSGLIAGPAALGATRAVHSVITLSAAKGAQTTQVRVRGTGFGDAERLSVFFDTTRLAVTRTTPGGRFGPVVITVPGTTTAGEHQIMARGLATHRTASAAFTVPADGTDWAQSRFDPSQDADNTSETVLRPGNVALLHKAWTFTGTGGIISSPIVAGSLAYVVQNDFKIEALKASSGALNWTINFYDQLYSTPAVVDGTLYIGSYVESKLYAFNAVTDKEKWFFQTGDRVEAAPTIADGVIYVASDQLYAVQPGTGHKIWNFNGATASYDASPAVADGIVYAGSLDGSMYAVSAATGDKIWSFPTGDRIFSAPAVADGMVYFGSDNGTFYALNADTGQEVWHLTLGGFVQASAAVAGDTVYFGEPDGNLYALDASTGATKWTAATGSAIVTSPAVANGVVYVGSNKHVYAFGTGTGKLLWSHGLGNAAAGSPVVANGRVYIASGNDTLYCFALK